MAGLALTGAAALPVAYYTHRHLTREEEPQTPDEASLDLAATDGIRLGDRLRGLWDLRLVGGDAELPGCLGRACNWCWTWHPRGAA